MIYKTLSMLMLMAGFIMAACGGDDDGTTPGSNIVIVDYNIETPTIWYGDSIYIIEKYDFYVDNVLTLQPGTIIKFHPEYGPYLMLGGGGLINATGSASKPIVFTSYFDDVHGGDSNEDGHATQPEVKDWGEINTNGQNSSVFKFCYFLYGGGVNFNATLTANGNNIEIENCRFMHNDGSYFFVGVLDASHGGTGTSIRNNVFFGNIRPLTISTYFDLDNSNIFHDPDHPSVINEMNGIFVNMDDDITAHRTWSETEVAYVLYGYQNAIDTEGSLSLGNDVVIKFMDNGELRLETGEGQLINHNGTGVSFTSFKDDARKGDTNGDGNTTSANEYDWLGIYDNSLTVPYPHYFTWGNIYNDSY